MENSSFFLKTKLSRWRSSFDEDFRTSFVLFYILVNIFSFFVLVSMIIIKLCDKLNCKKIIESEVCMHIFIHSVTVTRFFYNQVY